MFSFNGTNGRYPESYLTLVGSRLYGTTIQGGSYGDGNAFSINTDGTGYTDLLDFNGVDGMDPYGGLPLVGSTLYGTTSGLNSQGVHINNGTIFSVNTDGSSFATAHSFNGADGEEADSGLVLSGSTLYGTTEIGGVNGDGTVSPSPSPSRAALRCSRAVRLPS